MARPKPATFDKQKTVADNRRVRYDYHVEETFEAGLALQGTEVKALRAGEASIKESYAEVRDGQVWLVNANIPEYSHGNRLNHEPRRPRKLLLHEREIEKLFGAVERKGMTLVPLSIYFNSTGRAKVELALAKGKQAHDKRQSIKERDWKRDKARLMREGGSVAILSLGTRLSEALAAADLLAAHGLPTTVVDARFAKPLDQDLIRRIAAEEEPVEEPDRVGDRGTVVATVVHVRRVQTAGCGATG